MPARPASATRSKGSAGERRILETLRAGFAGQARASGQILQAIRRTNQGLERMSHRFADLCLVVGDLSASVDRLAQGTAASFERLHEAMIEQGRRIEVNNQRLGEMGERLGEMGERLGEMGERLGEMGERLEANNRLIAESHRRMEEQGVRLEAIGRRIDENTAAIRENTAAILRLAEAIRRTGGDGQPGGAGA